MLVTGVAIEACVDGVVLVASVLTNILVDKLVLAPAVDVVTGATADGLVFDFTDVVTALLLVVVVAIFVLVALTAALPNSTVHADEI